MNVYPSLIVNMFDFIGEEGRKPSSFFVPSIVRSKKMDCVYILVKTFVAAFGGY